MMTKITQLLNDLLKNDRELKKELKKIAQAPRVLNGWLPAEDVKEILRISASTLYRYMNNGTLPYSKIGSRTLFSENDINQLLERNYRRTGTLAVD